MRLKLFACAALTAVGLAAWTAPVARAADPKSKTPANAKKKPAELGGDKAIDKTLQWEDKVMGPDDKRAELDKIARAQAITKAAAEKAEKEKAAQEKQAAREAAQPKPQVKRNEVALPSVDDSPKPEKKVEVVETAPPPPPPVKPADDKFIDKLLKDEGTSRKKSSKADDKELEALLGSVPKPAAKSKSKKGDMVDNLLDSADKGPAMPAPKAKPVLPEWANKPDIAPAAPPPPVAVVRPQPKRDDGVIHVVQDAAGSSSAPPSRPSAVAARMPAPSAPAGRRQVAAKSGGWNDPFADAGSKGGSRSSSTGGGASRDPFADDAPAPRRPAPASRREAARAPAAAPAASSWNDPFADGPAPRQTKRAAATPPPAPKAKAPEPAARPAWKDPFTDAPAPSRGAVAMREHAARPPETSSSSAAPAAESHGSSRWGVIKKRR
jgi:hypothetical protein